MPVPETTIVQNGSAILACVGADGVDFAMPSALVGEVERVERIEAIGCPTFTDALMRYAEKYRLSLRDHHLFMSIAGAVNGTTVRTTNGRWFISVAGLRAVTAGEPMVVNDVAAMAWATANLPNAMPFGRASGMASTRKGRHAIISAWRGGLGAACVDWQDGAIRVVESEAGHTPFAAHDDDDWLMAKACNIKHGEASYERILFDLMDGQKLHRAFSSDALEEKFASLLGRYSATVALTFTSWDGIYLSGAVFDRIAKPHLTSTFRTSFEGKGKMRSMLQQIPSQLFQVRNGSLSGLSILCGKAR